MDWQWIGIGKFSVAPRQRPSIGKALVQDWYDIGVYWWSTFVELGLGLTEDWHWIGNRLESDWLRIGLWLVSNWWSIGQLQTLNLSMDWHEIDSGLVWLGKDVHWIGEHSLASHPCHKVEGQTLRWAVRFRCAWLVVNWQLIWVYWSISEGLAPYWLKLAGFPILVNSS